MACHAPRLGTFCGSASSAALIAEAIASKLAADILEWEVPHWIPLNDLTTNRVPKN
jgi:hypothetical protein